MTTTVLPCPKCGLPVRLRQGETAAECAECGTQVSTLPGVPPLEVSGGAALRQTVLSVSLVVVALGLVSMATHRHRRASVDKTPAPPTAIYTAPVIPPIAPTPPGELAWEAHARAPVVARVNTDDVEDTLGFFRVWDGTSAWIAHAGAFDGVTQKVLWQTEAIDPQLVKQSDVLPLIVVAGHRALIADASPTLRVFELATGEKITTLKLTGPVSDVCVAPDSVDRIWVHVDGGDAMVDLESSKSDATPRPKWCPQPQYQDTLVPAMPVPPFATPKEIQSVVDKGALVAACDRTFENARVGHSVCRAPQAVVGDNGFLPAYELSDSANSLSVAVGTKLTRPVARGTTKGAVWDRDLVPADIQAKPGPPPISDLAFGRLYVVAERIYFDARLVAVDARTGDVLWEAPLVGSLPRSDGTGRGEARGLVATASRLYVVRAGGGLDIFDAASGKPIGSIGKQ